MRTPLDAVPTAHGRLPVLGHLGPLLTRPLRFVRSLRADGDLVRLYFGRRPVYFVAGAALLRDLLVDHGSDWTREASSTRARPFSARD